MTGTTATTAGALRRDRTGGAAIEAAFAVPVLIALVMGILQLGMVFVANAGLRQAVESGARYATVYVKTNAHPDVYPTDAEVIAKVRASGYGMNSAGLTVSTPVRGTDATNGQKYVDVSASYPYAFNFIFFSAPAVTLRYSRRVYQMPT